MKGQAKMYSFITKHTLQGLRECGTGIRMQVITVRQSSSPRTGCYVFISENLFGTFTQPQTRKCGLLVTSAARYLHIQLFPLPEQTPRQLMQHLVCTAKEFLQKMSKKPSQ